MKISLQGGIEELERDINMLSRSEVLILSPCSLALQCGYLSEGLVLIDKTIITEHRPNVFNGCEGSFEVFENIGDKIELIKSHLSLLKDDNSLDKSLPS